MAIQGVETSPDLKLPELKVEHGESLANEMKDIKRQRAEREVLRDVSLAKKLVAIKASPVYNSSGEIIQATGFNV